MEKDKIYSLVIIGAGPAGMSASIYAARYGVENVIIGGVLGGQIAESHLVDNYLGLEDITGLELAQKFAKHVKKYGTEIVPNLVKNIKKDDCFEIELEDGDLIKSKTILLGTGTKRRALGLAEEEKFKGKGLSYCATCDGFFYKNKTVAVVGGSDSAAGAALYLAAIAEKVYLIYRREALRAEPYWINLIKKNPKIEVIYNTNIINLSGENRLEKIKLDNPYKNQTELSVDGVFVEVGSDPNIGYAQELGIKLDKDGYIEIESDSSASVPGVWAAGDITNGSDKFRQVITAAAEGAIAARSIANYLKKA